MANSLNHIKVYWDDTLGNYSASREREVKKYFEKKYNASVNVVFRAIKNVSSSDVDDIQANADATDQVLDINYQRKLVQKYLDDNNIAINWNHFIKLDDNVNSKIASSQELNMRYKKFKILKIHLNNFLSYADVMQTISLDNLKGLSIIASQPKNKAGKTSGIVDALLFLFFGKTTKTSTFDEVFNLYTKSDTVIVKGEVEIDNQIYVIERKVTRKLKRDKTNYNIENELNFWQLLPDGTPKDLKGEERRETDKKITEYIGNYDDFLITIITTIRNFYSLVDAKPTERGKIFTRFIGVEILAEKSEMAKKMLSDWVKTSKLSYMNSDTISKQISDETDKLTNYKSMLNLANNDLEQINKKISDNDIEIKLLEVKKHKNVDEELYKVKEDEILSGIEKLKNLIIEKTDNIERLKKDLVQPESEFDIDSYNNLKDEIKVCSENVTTNKIKKEVSEKLANDLKNSEFCPACKRKFENADNSKEIAEKLKEVEEYGNKMSIASQKLKELNDELSLQEKIKDAWTVYDKAKLIIERNEVELSTYKSNLELGENKLAKYLDNKKFIEENRLLDTEINKFNILSSNNKNDREHKLLEIKGYEKDIEQCAVLIEKHEQNKKDITKDEIIQKIYQIYIEVFGKNGISKMILGTMIPIINSYLNQMMLDAVPFKLEVRLNDKNEVEFWMVDDDSEVEKLLKSGSGYESTISILALRCVLSKVCSLPKPNIVVFDEVFGQVADENMPLLGAFFERVKEYFDNIFIITHNPIMLDWADHMVQVKKENNLTYINYDVNEKK